MSRGYGKYRRGGGTHANFHFDNLFKENSNKPSAARSAATVGKWGITSFTSIRSIVSNNDAAAAPKPKKFFKSRNTEPPDLSDAIDTYKPSSPPYSPPKRSRITYEPSDRTTRAHSPRKFFSSKSTLSTEKTVLSSNVNKTSEPPKPPIVLRICRGKSQLLNDSDESESTPTPSSTPSTSTVTSPRALRDSSRPANCRITRSARRSMQQDPSSSPATADTPGEFSMFTSPKADNDLSPQYIPAEKYELERKAMYDNLLRPNSPKNASIDQPIEDCDKTNFIAIVDPTEKDEKEESEEEGEKEMEIEEPLKEPINETINEVETEPHADPIQEEEKEESEEEQDDQMEIEENIEDTPEVADDISVSSPKPEPEQGFEPEVQKELPKSIDEEWTTDSDSNSTAPEMEVKQIIPDPSYTVNPIREHEDEILDKILEKPMEQAPPVKLVISKKKGSIFKSRTLVDESGSKKRRALYRHKWTDDNKESDKDPNKSEENVEANVTNEDDAYGFEDGPLERITKESENGDITSVRCSKEDKAVSIKFIFITNISTIQLYFYLLGY